MLAAAVPVLLGWDLSGLDLPLARWVGGPEGFALREHWLLTRVLHQGGRLAAWTLALALVLAIWWPVGALRRLTWARRLQLAVTPMVITALVGLIKARSATSCPWGLADFGAIEAYHSHWRDFWATVGARGHCFPAGHAMAGFAFVGGYWVFRDTDLRQARIWLAAALCAGLLFGVAQQLRGAHFMSHTLWSAWLACAAAMAIDALWRRRGAALPCKATGALR
jgi:membrane-associated PAP2 superfamily phosphatase